MKSQKLNRDKNVIKKKKIINGINYYELNINEDNYTINIINMPKENLIKFKLYLSHENELKISSKDSYTIYENVFSLDYFLNQTQFLSEININNIEDLIRFLHTYFQEYNENQKLINYEKNNPNIVILKLLLFHNNIQINIQLYNNKKINLKHNINDNDNSKSNTCKNFYVNKKELKTPINKKANDDNSLLLTDNYLPLIIKNIPLLQKLTKEKLYLMYKSSKENENKNFHIKCDDKGPTLIFIQTEENRSFITFNKKSWHIVNEEEKDKASWKETNTKDDHLVIIDLFSEKKIEIKKNGNGKENDVSMKFIQQYGNYGPSYVDDGFSFKIFGEDKYLSISFLTNNDEEENYVKNNYKLEKNNFLHIKEYEIYGFKKNSK